MQVRDAVLRWLEEFGRGARIVFALAVVVFVLAVTEFVASLSTGKAIDQERAKVVEQLSSIRARLEGEINSTLHLSRGMISYVATHPALTWNDFEPLATEMVTTGRHIRNLALARFVWLATPYTVAPLSHIVPDVVKDPLRVFSGCEGRLSPQGE